MSGIRGFIEYDSTSQLSPEYPHPIVISGREYSSPTSAIDAENPMEVMLTFVSTYRNIFFPYRYYIFQGTYSDILNRAIQQILIPKREPIVIIDVYQYMYSGILPPEQYTVRIRRNVYITEKVRENLYRQIRPLQRTEVYDVALVGDIPLYIGLQGSFFLISNIEDVQRVEEVLRTLQ